jgi:hypothetical protein
MTKKKLGVLWFLAALILLLAVGAFPEGWRYSGEGYYLRLDVVHLALVPVVALGVYTIWWLRHRRRAE